MSGLRMMESTLQCEQSLSIREIVLVQTTWEQVKPISEVAASMFYDRLFELDPTLRPLFSRNLFNQKKKLMATLSFTVEALSRPEELMGELQALGRRHRDYKALPEHYDTVREALLWTLEQGLGSAFSVEVRMAWTKTYDALASTMLDAAANS